MAIAQLVRRAALTVALAWLPSQPRAADYEWLSASLQARIGEQTVLGKQSPESFNQVDLKALVRTPWEHPFGPGLVAGVRGLGTVGLFEGPDKTAAVVAAIPVLALGTADGRFAMDGGLGIALLSEHRYAEQDFGGPAQAALTVGLEAPLYARLGVAYRFMHYSDAGAYGPHTVGADLHMAGLTYRF